MARFDKTSESSSSSCLDVLSEVHTNQLTERSSRGAGNPWERWRDTLLCGKHYWNKREICSLRMEAHYCCGISRKCLRLATRTSSCHRFPDVKERESA